MMISLGLESNVYQFYYNWRDAAIFMEAKMYLLLSGMCINLFQVLSD